MQNSKRDFKFFHQNIRGLVNKVDELLISLSNTNPQLLCISEHHLHSEQICHINLEQYTLGTYYCRKHCKMGGVSIFTLKNQYFEVVNLNNFCKEKDFSVCALKLLVNTTYLIVLCIYRSPTGDFSYFLSHLEKLLITLYSVSKNIILCGDFNVNFHVNSMDPISTSRASAIELLLHSFCLEG